MQAKAFYCSIHKKTGKVPWIFCWQLGQYGLLLLLIVSTQFAHALVWPHWKIKYQICSYSKNRSAQMIPNETCEHIEQYEVVLVLTPVSWF